MFDEVIADVGSNIGEWDGIYGEPYSDLGVDMFGDINLEDLPTVGPRAATPTSSNVVVQAIARKVQENKMKAPEKTLTKPVAVVRKGITPKSVLPRIDANKAVKLVGIGLAAILIWEFVRSKK